MAERILCDIARAHDQRTAVLRYFNVAGDHDDGTLGEATPDNSHLIKLACGSGLGRRGRLRLKGDDYPTPDGTCIRDYVHVQDLAEAHVAALARLVTDPIPIVVNFGYGRGYSVHEVVDTFRRVTGVDLDPEIGPRRPGNPVRFTASLSCWTGDRSALTSSASSRRPETGSSACRLERHQRVDRRGIGTQ
jgi:UDP-glucose 4-epimerase